MEASFEAARLALATDGPRILAFTTEVMPPPPPPKKKAGRRARRQASKGGSSKRSDMTTKPQASNKGWMIQVRWRETSILTLTPGRTVADPNLHPRLMSLAYAPPAPPSQAEGSAINVNISSGSVMGPVSPWCNTSASFQDTRQESRLTDNSPSS